MKRLFERFDGDLKVEDIDKLDEEELKELIRESNYNK